MVLGCWTVLWLSRKALPRPLPKLPANLGWGRVVSGICWGPAPPLFTGWPTVQAAPGLGNPAPGASGQGGTCGGPKVSVRRGPRRPCRRRGGLSPRRALSGVPDLGALSPPLPPCLGNLLLPLFPATGICLCVLTPYFPLTFTKARNETASFQQFLCSPAWAWDTQIVSDGSPETGSSGLRSSALRPLSKIANLR